MFTAVICVMFTVAFVAGGVMLRKRYRWDDSLDTPLFFGLFGLIHLALMFGLACLLYHVEGLYEGYGDGERVGYVTKVSYKGIIWKTWEVEVQMGAGEQAALQRPWQCSTTDATLAEAMNNSIGKRVHVHYSEWLVMPWSRGSSGYEIRSITER